MQARWDETSGGRQRLAKQVGHEATCVPRDETLVLPDADAARMAVHQPTADDGGVPAAAVAAAIRRAKAWRRKELLVDERSAVVRAARFQDGSPLINDGDVRALAAQHRFTN